MSRRFVSSALLGVLLLSGAPGKTVTVTTPNDEDDGGAHPSLGTGTSLREALAYGSSPVAVVFDPALDGKTFPGFFTLRGTVTIDASILPNGIVLSQPSTGGGVTPVLKSIITTQVDVPEGATATFMNCLFQGESGTNFRALAVRGTATLDDCTVQGYRFTNAAREAVVFNSGDLTLNRCLLQNNSSHLSKEEEGGRGGAIFNRGTLQMNDCRIHGNSAGWSGGGLCCLGVSVVRRSTFTENNSGRPGGVVTFSAHPGDGFGHITLLHCTFSGNEETAVIGARTIRSCTIVNNPQGVRAVGARMENCIVANNDRGDVSGSFFGNNTNLIGNPENGTFLDVAPLIGEPILSPLGYFGSHTMVHVPLPGSPALDAGEILEADVDQSGQARPVGAVELGSVEANALHNRDAFERWTYQFLPPGVDQSFHGDPDDDQVVNGFEWGVGTNPFLFDRASPRRPRIRRFGSGIELTFALDPLAAPLVSLNVTRFTNPDNPTVVYEYDGATGNSTTATGITVFVTGEQFTLTDRIFLPKPAGYYTLEITRTTP